MIIVFTIAALIHLYNDVIVQEKTECSRITYSSPAASTPTYQLDRIEGEAVYGSPAQKWELGSANGICVTIFDKKSKARVASVTTDDKGQFEFSIAPGDYILLATAGDLQAISISIHLRPAAGGNKSRRLLLHLRERKDNTKSYATTISQPALRKELLALAEQDQSIRNEMIKAGVDHPNTEILARMDAIDRHNTSRIKTMIKKYGWPGPGLVGWNGSEAAFLLIQHSDHLTQKRLLPLIRREFSAGNLRGQNYALFIDRVLVEDGRPQIYGSRPKPFDQWSRGQPALYPIEDRANVDKRRAKLGLPPLAEYLEALKRMYYPKNK